MTIRVAALVAVSILAGWLWSPAQSQQAPAAEAPAKEAPMGALLEYKDGDTLCEGYLARPQVAEEKTVLRAGILIVHAWMGLTQFEKDKAEALAKLGYVVLAVDMFGKGVRPANTKEAQEQTMKFRKDPVMALARIDAALQTLKKQSAVEAHRIGIMGYCFGGSIALGLARGGAEIAAAVSFHGGLANTIGKSEIKCSVMVLHGADDPFVPVEDVDAIKEEFKTGKVDWQFVEFGNSVHSFTNPGAGDDNTKGAAYNEKADKRSWELMKDFFAERLK